MKYKQRYLNKNKDLMDLLVARGVQDMDKFLYPSIENWIDETLLDNIEEGYQLYKSHLEKHSVIDLIVDCDVDGYTSSAIFYLLTKCIDPTIEIRYHIHTGKQHGLEDQIDELLNIPDVSFVVCPDSSSNDYEYHKSLKEQGVDILILDHHEADYYSPYAITINNQLSRSYPNKGLSGATITYKFAVYCNTRFTQDRLYEDRSESDILGLIDLAAVGAIGDMMDVTTLENRYLFSEGLSHISNYGLKVLIDKQAFSLKDITNLNPIGIAFYIVPLINALIRVGSYNDKITLFRSFIEGTTVVQSTKRGAKIGQMETIAEQSARNCVNAKNKQKREEDKAVDKLDMIIQSEGLNDNKVLLVEINDGSIDPNITGLIAMKLMNKYNKPVLLGRDNGEGYLKGSIRNNGNNEIADFRKFLEDSGLFEYVQGHASAAGFSIPTKNIERFLDYANGELSYIASYEGTYLADFIFGKDEDFSSLIHEIDTWKCLWGQNCDEPLIVVEEIPVSTSSILIMGQSGDTIKFVHNGIEYIKFHAKDFIKEISGRDFITITVLGNGSINRFMGKETPQIQIRDYNIKSSILEF